MSLERTALRIATVMALSGGFQAPWPTMAQGRVFDSRFDPLQLVDMKTDDVLPVITVCTDDDRGTSLSDNNGGPPFLHTVSLCIDISIGMVGGSDERAEFLVMPQTEPELEAMIDVFERQVKAALINPAALWSGELQKVLIRIGDWSSVRYVESDSNVRLASRRITAAVTLPSEDLTEIATDPPSTAAIPAPLGPLLTAIAASGSPYAGSAQALTDMLLSVGASQPVTLPMLERVRFIESEQAETNDADVPRGPRADGVAEADLS